MKMNIKWQLQAFVVVFLVGFLGVFNILQSRKIQPPKKGMHTIKSLFDTINTNNPRKSSLFIVPLRNKKVMTQAEMSRPGYKKMNGSASSKKIGIDKNWVEDNGSKKVELKQDKVLVQWLLSKKRVLKKHRDQYKKILLYFNITKDGKMYRLYINDPWPARWRRIRGKYYSAAEKIIKKWDVGSTSSRGKTTKKRKTRKRRRTRRRRRGRRRN